MLLVLNLLHSLIWAWLLLGGCVSPRMARWNLEMWIPGVYLCHLLPFHVLIRWKVRQIYTDRMSSDLTDTGPTLRTCSPSCSQRMESKVMDQIRGYLPPISEEEVQEIARIYLEEEARLVLPALLRRVNECMFAGSFQKPLSAQGMLILAALWNYAALRHVWRAVMV